MKTGKEQSRLSEVAAWFLRLGLTGFGGPAVHIAMMEQEIVHRRNWMTKEHFLDLIGATNLIPGPNSTEMTMHCGYHRAGLAGLFVAGVCFIMPAALITMLIAFGYSRYGRLPQVEPFLTGITPAIAIIVLQTSVSLGRSAFKKIPLLVPAVLIIAASLYGLPEIPALFAGAALGVLLLSGASFKGVFIATLPFIPGKVEAASSQAKAEPNLLEIFLFFLKIGSVLYGSGYVLLAFLEGGLVQDLGWLTQKQLVDALAVGQFTPGPILSTATFIGYMLAGVPGAIVATLGVFLPSFFFVMVANPLIPKIRNNIWTARILDSLNGASVALMIAVSLKLVASSLQSPAGIVLLMLLAVLGLVLKVNGTILVLVGAVSGSILHLVGI